MFRVWKHLALELKRFTYPCPEVAQLSSEEEQSFSEPVLKFRGILFSRKRPDGEARRGRISLVDLRLRSNEASRPFPRKPSGGGGFFGHGLPWLGAYSPLRGCLCPCGSTLAALATAKIPRRRMPRNF